jgi:predicted DNA binding CopG/RHH family protein
MDEKELTAQADEFDDIEDKELTAQLDAEEREILESYERGEWVSVHDEAAAIARHQAVAANTLRKDRRVNIRITGYDLAALQTIAGEEGLPYQTLMASILHKYVTGRLVERPRTIPATVEYVVHEEREKYDD